MSNDALAEFASQSECKVGALAKELAEKASSHNVSKLAVAVILVKVAASIYEDMILEAHRDRGTKEVFRRYLIDEIDKVLG